MSFSVAIVWVKNLQTLAGDGGEKPAGLLRKNLKLFEKLVEKNQKSRVVDNKNLLANA